MGELFASVTHPASKASFCLLGGGGEKVSLPESRQAFGVATAQTSGLVNLVFPCQTVFLFSKSIRLLINRWS